MILRSIRSLIILLTLVNSFQVLGSDRSIDASEMMKRYEQMFQKMLDDVNTFDSGQFGEYERLMKEHFFDQLNQLNQLGLNDQLYTWKELKESRVLIFNGVFLEDGKTVIEVKNRQIQIKGNLENISSKRKSSHYIEMSLPVPRDCDESKISFKVIESKTHIYFSKYKQKRIPLKRDKFSPTI